MATELVSKLPKGAQGDTVLAVGVNSVNRVRRGGLHRSSLGMTQSAHVGPKCESSAFTSS